MGAALLIGRLGLKGILHRPAQAVLLLLAIAAGATTLTLALALGRTTDDPYARTRAATNGPDVVATLVPGALNGGGPSKASPGRGSGPETADPGLLAPLEHASGVIAYSGPFPVTWTSLQKGQTTGTAEIEGRSSAASSVDRPQVIQGSWVRSGGVVVEAAYAQALDVHVGDRLRLGAGAFDVVGTAVTAAFPTYGQICYRVGCFLVGSLGTHSPGLVWLDESDFSNVAVSGPEPVFYFLNLKLADPATAPAFADRFNAGATPAGPALFAWQTIRDADAEAIADVQKALIFGSSLLALLAIASVAVLAGGRMAEQTRRVGLLKAVGGSPEFVALVLLCEHVLIGFGAAGVGLVVGWLAVPLADGPGPGLLGAPSAPSLTAPAVALVLALGVVVAVVATLAPAVRAARQSTVAALQNSARVARRRARVIRFSASLPPSLLLGTRLVTRRPRRLLLNVFSVGVTASGLVAILIVHATAGNFLKPAVEQATTIISLMLVVLASVNGVMIAWATAIDAQRSGALARALGATPGQITMGLSVAQALPALVGALLGIAGGIGISYAATKSGNPPTLPAANWLVLMVISVVVVMAVLTAITTAIGARRGVSEVLRSEAV